MPAKILIVDDEPDLELLIRQRFRRQIREQVYDFLFARNGAEALTAVRADAAFDLVLSDINMPVMDGLTLLGHLRHERPRLGTVIVSAYGDMPNIRAAMNLGALDFLTKPIDFHDFEVTVAKALRQVEEQRQAARDHEQLVAVERDLATAAEIQQSFLPPPEPSFDGRTDVVVRAAMLPARSVGGDFYDYFFLDPRRLAVVIGDVSGKGVPAALYMAVTRTLLRANAFRGLGPGECLTAVNGQLLRDSSSLLFATVFYTILDTETGELSYSAGGHPSPYLLRAAAMEQLDGKGLLVGGLPEATYKTKQARLEPGDLLVLSTDGLPEARNRGGAFLTRPGLEAALREEDRSRPGDLIQGVLDAVRRFADGAAPSDDQTVLALHYPGAPGKGAS
jgi:sigma-B regulation protein RsbU (phosphoserine phosphatase)